ncbi:ABC transporter substrate-binding protein [Herbaspirillum sp. LeCh32-8]|uniref:ABC transporter substrate-binding protein n=1 Tax=Herbaspirillum sp. LeCh32-8 TaxID=2821356 RepID=UPI001AEA46E8|nr:ABC transporter substrate-binding protein [Herbaspirillum sp. LeCh32-8]MBP0598852.1 ABC transporter substrate-binding protein [Herbaspirillum sp. LeCh32-8]
MMKFKQLKEIAVIGALALIAAQGANAQAIPKASYVESSGKFTIASTIYAPFAYVDSNGKRVGPSIELAEAAAKLLNATLVVDETPFTSLIPSLKAGRIKIAWLNATATAERLQQVDFVAWIKEGTVVSTLPENKATYAKRTALCGRTVAVQSGTAADFSADTLNAECKSSGLREFKKDIYPSQQETVQAVISRRADAYLDDSTAAGYYSKVSNGRLVITGEGFNVKPVGHIIAKGDTETAKMVAGVMQALIDNGTYLAILNKWGMGFAAVDKAIVYTDASQIQK